MYSFSDETMKQLNYILNTFKSACHHIDSGKLTAFHSATDFDTESTYNPHYYYNFQFRDKFCQIERLGKSFNYTIRCHNFIPDNLECHSNGLDFCETYGFYDNLDLAIQDFSKVASSMVKYIQPSFIF